MEKVDAIEGFNGAANFYIPLLTSIRANKKAQNFYTQALPDFPHLGLTIGQDGHSFFELGLTNMLVPKPDISNSDTLSASLREYIREHKRISPQDRTARVAGFIGGFTHLSVVAGCMFLSKIGIRNYPEIMNNASEKPNQE